MRSMILVEVTIEDCIQAVGRIVNGSGVRGGDGSRRLDSKGDGGWRNLNRLELARTLMRDSLQSAVPVEGIEVDDRRGSHRLGSNGVVSMAILGVLCEGGTAHREPRRPKSARTRSEGDERTFLAL